MSTSTIARRSIIRPRPSLGHATVVTASVPDLRSSLPSPERPQLPNSHSSGRRPSAYSRLKTYYPPLPSDDSATIFDAIEANTPVTETGSSPFTMYPSRPAASRTATDDKNANQNLEVGDIVDVPGGMHGTIKFIGEVRGKKGHFAGVELGREFASKGKNDGDVDGIRYFTTSVKGAGIFLPSNKAYKRLSPSFSSDSMPLTPDTPDLGSSYMGARRADPKVYTPASSSKTKFSQSVGPGRARSPDLKPKVRPSMNRPESPLRRPPTATSTPSGRPSVGVHKLSKSTMGTPRYAPSPTPGKFGASVRGPTMGDPGRRVANVNKPTPRTPNNARPQSRSDSRLGPEAMFDEDSDNTPIGVAKIMPAQLTQHQSRPRSNQDEELRQLRHLLETRDTQLEKQTSDLREMQNSIDELQSATPKHNSSCTARSRGSGIDELDAASLCVLVREKNEKIATLTRDFDAHRAQFRSTIDSLERTSDETNRIYEQQVDGLRHEIKELQDRGDDVESVAQQLKQLEELVQELEEGLEDARRGEAEARGEVEFLRGEVERTRSELRREREKAAAALKGAGASLDGKPSAGGSSKEVEQRDDEIRGLKAIIHSLSRDAQPDAGSPKHGSRRVSRRQSGQTNGHVDNQIAEERQAREKLEREVKELEGLVDRKTYREEELEQEILRLRKPTAHVSVGSNGYSEQTAVPKNSRQPSETKAATDSWHEQISPMKRHGTNLEPMPESDSHSTTMTDSSTLYCEMCETFGHEIFTCPNINGDQPPHNEQRSATSGQTGLDTTHKNVKNLSVSSPHNNDYPPPLSPARSPARSPAATPKAKMPNPMDPGPAPGKGSGIVDMEKWCALCEKDGHESVDCPFEEMY